VFAPSRVRPHHPYHTHPHISPPPHIAPPPPRPVPAPYPPPRHISTIEQLKT
jgi:hypothetical protein